MRRSSGDDNALKFLFTMPRVDFTPRDVDHYFWNGGGREKWHKLYGTEYGLWRGVSASESGWRKRLARLETLGCLKRVFPSAPLYEWTQEGLLAVNLVGGVANE